MALLDPLTILSTAACLVVVWFLGKIASLLRSRQKFKHVPGPPWHPVMGHLMAIADVVQKMPQRAHPHLLMTLVMRHYNLPGVFVMDTRPAGADVTLIVADPEIARQLSESGLPKHPSLATVLEPLAGKHNLVTSEGTVWRKWRNIFNPGFSTKQVISQVPAIIECGEAFVKLLDDHAAASRVFRLEEETTKVTIDVIGRVVCDHDFKTLTTDNEFLTTMRKTLAWMPDQQSLNPLHRQNPLRPLFWKYYKRQMDKYIGKVLDERFAARGPGSTKKEKKKTGIDLALEEYLKESGNVAQSENAPMNPEFRRYAIDNLLVLLFAGHDTTASTLCYIYHLLQKNPDKLARLRSELDTVFGKNMSATEQLRSNPYKLNQCEYTLAVIKEVLRLWTPASTVRLGQKGYFIHDPKSGATIDTEGLLVWIVGMCIHRNANVWGPDVDEFKPERFLPENAEELPPNAWRPFEKGPRNCIGQELALIEMKVILAMTAREFDIKAAFEELGSLSDDGTLWAKDASFRKGTQEVFGESMYQVLLAAGKPREAMPARASRTEFGRA